MTQDNLLDMLEAERTNQGMSVKELCDKAGIVNYTYYHWQNRISSPKICNLLDVLHALGLDMKICRIKGEKK